MWSSYNTRWWCNRHGSYDLLKAGGWHCTKHFFYLSQLTLRPPLINQRFIFYCISLFSFLTSLTEEPYCFKFSGEKNPFILQDLLSNRHFSKGILFDLVAKSCLSLCDPMDCNLQGSSFHVHIHTYTHTFNLK